VPTRLIRLFLLAASLSFTGAAVVAFFGTGMNPLTTTAIAVADRPVAPIELTTTLLPTVRVHPEAEMPTLATVTVRPNRTDLADVSATSTTVASTVSAPLLARRPKAVLMSSGGFDMPYYSFGKTLRHVSKE
jgi:hypothetical protein